MRYYNLFKTQEERSKWEREKKKANDNFQVCFRIPVKYLKKEVYLTDEQIATYKFATVWRNREDD